MWRFLLRITEWLERKMHSQPEYSRNDAEWNALQNECNAIKRDIRRGIKEKEGSNE